jgi:type IV pilus assembly protein PilB
MNCRAPFEPDEAQLRDLRLTEEDIKGKKFYYGRGCNRCNGTGYKGRVGIFEIMTFTDEIRDLVMNRASTNVLRTAALKAGMKQLRENGLAALYEGVTSIDEIAKETMIEA